MKTVLILGGTGMLGHQLYKSLKREYNVIATIRGSYNFVEKYNFFDKEDIREFVDALYFDSVIRAMAAYQPDVVINCIGLIKQLPISQDPLWAITINAQLPHRISLVCASSNIRLIHISTDCVFSGKTGNYLDDDISDADDIYGRTKYLGEVSYKPHTTTLRTSIIGRELKGRLGLLEWFLSQEEHVDGYNKAIFSGFPTHELSNIISEYVIPNENLTGVYNVSSDPISKYDLLNIVKDIYKKDINIKKNEGFVIDRSLNSEKFKQLTGYKSPDWHTLVKDMKNNS